MLCTDMAGQSSSEAHVHRDLIVERRADSWHRAAEVLIVADQTGG